MWIAEHFGTEHYRLVKNILTIFLPIFLEWIFGPSGKELNEDLTKLIIGHSNGRSILTLTSVASPRSFIQ